MNLLLTLEESKGLISETFLHELTQVGVSALYFVIVSHILSSSSRYIKACRYSIDKFCSCF